MNQKCALVMAGGTGGHIFPGLAVAEALRERGWRVHWLGGKGGLNAPSMESQLVPQRGFAFEGVDFSGVRGKGLRTLILLPLRLLKAFWQSLAVLRRVRYFGFDIDREIEPLEAIPPELRGPARSAIG